jgi:hypothetical protein
VPGLPGGNHFLRSQRSGRRTPGHGRRAKDPGGLEGKARSPDQVRFTEGLRAAELLAGSSNAWSARDIEALQSAGDGSIRLQGSLREILDGIKD